MGGFDLVSRASEFKAWPKESVEDERLFYESRLVNPMRRRLNAEHLAGVGSIVSSYDEELEPLSHATAEALYDALASSLAIDRFEFLPSQVKASIPADPRRHRGAFGHSLGMSLDGWDIEIHIDSADYPALDALVVRVNELRLARERAVRSFIADIEP